MISPASPSRSDLATDLAVTRADISEILLEQDAQYKITDLGFRTGLSSILADLPSEVREAADKFRYGTSGLLRFRSPKPLALNTLMTERQLQDCGLSVVGQEDVQRWLVPLDASDFWETRAAPDWLDGLISRITELKDIARDEELLFSEQSAQQAIAFARNLDGYGRPSVFLIANGNVRLLWASDVGEQIGLQFIGDGEVQYVLMARRETRIATVMGADRIDAIMRYINAAGLGQIFRQ